PFLPLLSLHSSSHHRYLHSFPTRRSSDLVSSGNRGLCALQRDSPRFSSDRRVRAPASKARPGRRHDGGLPRAVALSRDASSGAVDRKSTRLNSSHLVISYAVFCLKKKTTH